MQNSKQIGHILFNKIFLGYVLIAIIFTSYHIYVQYSLAKNTVLKEMTTIEKAFYNGLANSIWHLDEKQINANAQAIKSIQGIVGVSIISANDEVFSQKGTLSLEDEKYKTFLYKENKDIKYSSGLIKHSFEVIHDEFSEGEVLGSVSIYTSENAIYSIVKESLIFILGYTFIIIVVLWGLFNHFAKKLLTNPLQQIIQATQELNINEYKEITLNHNDKSRSELDTLVDTFNMMSKRINESFKTLNALTVTLNKQKQDLVSANQYQTDFLANMSHELKTPLNSINIISSVMAKNSHGELNDKQIKNLSIINKAGNELLVLINDVLDISKVEAGQLTIDFEPTNIGILINDVYDTIYPIAKNKGISLNKEIDIKNEIIISDPKRIRQIIQNLLSNAIKFTGKGRISFGVKDNAENIIIYVEDTGIGISKEKLEHIFDRFKQVDGSTTRKYGGTGLGLAISKELSLLLGGNLTVSSMVDKGSVFKLTLPKKAKVSNVCDDKIELKNMNDTEQEEHNEIELFAQTQKKKELRSKYKVILFNNNPVEFFSLIVALKKEDNIELLQLKNETEVIQELTRDDHSILIADIDSEGLELKKFIHNNTKFIGVSSTVQYKEEVDVLLQKPIDNTVMINTIYEKENRYE